MHPEPLPANPRISVVIPLFNGALYLLEALDSILGQTHAIDEVVVVDDGSTDESPAIAASYPKVRLITKEHSGFVPTLNRGIEETSGDLLTFLDHDDRWILDKTERQLALLRQRPEIDAVFGRARQFRMTEPRCGQEFEVPFEVTEGLCKVAGMFRRRAFDLAGGFGSLGGHDFMDWYTRAREVGLRLESLPEVVFERRQHFTNTGRIGREEQRRTYMTSLKAKLDRQRAAAAPNPPPTQPA
jgi:glycosyltransferase involved in cell wall biosynthesis